MKDWVRIIAAFWLLLPQVCTQTISVKVNVVNVNVIVKDEANRPVSGLTAEDFTLEEDGRRQKIRYFSRESELPLTLGLLVDASGSMHPHLTRQKTASAAFLENMLREQDEAFIVRFATQVHVVRSRTSSLPKLRSALKDVARPGDFFALGPTRRCSGFSTTPLYDAIIEGAAQIPKAGGKRNALIVLTDGFDHNSCATLRTAIEKALEADTILYVILYPLPQADPEAATQAREAMNKLAFFTGGDVFNAGEAPIEAIYATIAAELRELYSLGYSSDKPIEKEEYRRVRVTIQRPGAKVVARDGYFVRPSKKK